MEEGNVEVLVDAVGSLTENPDMISTEAADSALSVLDAGGDTPLTPECASSAVESVSSILGASDNNNRGTDDDARQKQKEMSTKIMNVANKLLDAVVTDGAVFDLDTALIKANKSPLDLEVPVEAKTKDGSGLDMSPTYLKQLDTEDGADLSVNLVSFAINTYKHDPFAEEYAADIGGTVSMNIKAQKNEVKVEQSELRVKLAIDDVGEGNVPGCAFWDDGEGLISTEGCAVVEFSGE